MTPKNAASMEPTTAPVVEPKVRLREVADLLSEARRLVNDDGRDSERVAFLQRKHDLLQRIVLEDHAIRAGGPG